MVWITTSDLHTYLGALSTGSSTALQPFVDAAQAEIEAFTGRTFEGTTGTRYYRANSLLDLDLPEGKGVVLYLGRDLCALGGLTNGDATTIASTDCWVEPRHGPPYNRIRLKTAEAWSFGTDGEIIVSGTWGYSSVAPADIIEYAKETAAYLYRLRSSQVFDVVASPETGTITVPKGMPVHVRKGLIDGGYVLRRPIT